MKLRIIKEEIFDSRDKKHKIYYNIERKYLFFWTRLLHPCMTSFEEAQLWAENYIYMNGKAKQCEVLKNIMSFR